MASSRVMTSSSPSPTTKPGLDGGGGSLGSMNMEEILRNICGDLPPAAAADVGAAATPAPPPPHPVAAAKSSEEVWKEISGCGGGGGTEMTLEDFLAREGATGDAYVAATAMGQVVAVEAGQVLGFGNAGESSGRSGTGRGRKRPVMDPLDRATMQRQKRMIKNRESAARSRERKQAYITELESLVAQLEEENAQLVREQEEHQKRLKEEHEKRLKELAEKLTPVIIRKKSRQSLRRTNSMEW